MTAKYEIKAIDFDDLPNRTADEYQRALNDATPIYKNSFAEVVEYIGTRPYRQRAGYTAHIGNTDYVITRRN